MRDFAIRSVFLPVLVACGGGAAQMPAPASVPPKPDDGYVANDPPKAKAAPEPFLIPSNLRVDVLEPETLVEADTARWSTLRKTYAGTIAAPAKTCAWTPPPKKGAITCPSTREELTVTLAKALDGSADKRDARLAPLETCNYPPGFIRSLRVELTAPECQDIGADPMLDALAKGTPPEIAHTLLGQSVSARLRRTSVGAPQLTAPFTKDRVLNFLKTELAPWIKKEADAIQTLAEFGAKSVGYGKGVIAIEAGAADLRLAEIIKEAPVPDDFKKDPELLSVYQQSLDALVKPRLDRGRDGVLVGMKKLAEVGVLSGPRLTHARKLLASMYAGKRIDALDSLLLPPDTTAPSKDFTLFTVLREAPTFFANGLLTEALANDGGLLSSAYLQGFPRVARSNADVTQKAAAPLRLVHARGHMRLGIAFWRATEFDLVLSLLRDQVAEPEARLFVALALALRGGPVDAVDMMRAKTPGELGIANVEALDALAKEKGPFAGLAAFNAARLLELAPPVNANKAYFDGIAERYTKSAELLLGADRDRAIEYAKHARETGAAVR
jgi:hypothetical protein